MTTIAQLQMSFQHRTPASRRRQRGLTLIELMVALTLGMVVALVAAGALIVARQGFSSVDASGQLRENARFAADLMQRIGVQSGFEDIAGGHSSRTRTEPSDPGVQGYDNAWLGLTPTVLPSSPAVTLGLNLNANRPALCTATDTSCANGDDILVVRYWGTSAPGTPTIADGGMINCGGIAEPERNTIGDRAYSIFHVIRSADNEPSLACTYRHPTTGVWTTVELIRGVEGFQVLYGVDNVTANATPAAGSFGQDSVADRYLTATQMVGPSTQATQDNWRRVRTLRIGLLLRGELASAQVRAVATWNVLGDSMSGASDVGAQLAVPADGRLRQRLVLTVHLRNQQGYEVCLTATGTCP